MQMTEHSQHLSLKNCLKLRNQSGLFSAQRECQHFIKFHGDPTYIFFNTVFFKTVHISFICLGKKKKGKEKKKASKQNREPQVRKSRLGSILHVILCKMLGSSVMKTVSKSHRHAPPQHLKGKGFSTTKSNLQNAHVKRSSETYFFNYQRCRTEFCRRNGLESILKRLLAGMASANTH